MGGPGPALHHPSHRTVAAGPGPGAAPLWASVPGVKWQTKPVKYKSSHRPADRKAWAPWGAPPLHPTVSWGGRGGICTESASEAGETAPSLMLPGALGRKATHTRCLRGLLAGRCPHPGPARLRAPAPCTCPLLPPCPTGANCSCGGARASGSGGKTGKERLWFWSCQDRAQPGTKLTALRLSWFTHTKQTGPT